MIEDTWEDGAKVLSVPLHQQQHPDPLLAHLLILLAAPHIETNASRRMSSRRIDEPSVNRRKNAIIAVRPRTIAVRHPSRSLAHISEFLLFSPRRFEGYSSTAIILCSISPRHLT